MFPVILAVAFVGTNIYGMYGNIPFTGINPTKTFLDRFLGSLQVTSTIYALQEIHPWVFPEVLDPPPSEIPSIFPSKAQEVVETVTEYVKVTAGLSSPTRGFENGTNSNRTDLQVVLPVYDDIPLFGWHYPNIVLYAYPMLSALAVFLIWEVVRRVIRRIMRPKQDDKVVLDAMLFAQLVAALKGEFKHRSSSQTGEKEDADSVARRANIIGVLDLVKIPAGSQLENNAPTIDSLIDMSQRITKVEEFIKLAFPYTGQGDATGSGDGSSGPKPGASSQVSSQKETTTYKAAFDNAMNDIDESVKDYPRIKNELDSVLERVRQGSIAQETIQRRIHELQSEFKKLNDAMAMTSDSDSDQVDSSETESDDHRYTDKKIKMSNTLWQTKYNSLETKMAALDNYLTESMDKIRHRQTNGFKLLDLKIEDVLQAPAGQLPDRTRLSRVIGEFIPLDNTIRELARRSNIAIKTLEENGEDISKLKDLKLQVENIDFTMVLLTAENEKIWETLKTISPEHVSKRAPEHKSSGGGRPAIGGDTKHSSGTASSRVDTHPTRGTSTTSPGRIKDESTEPREPSKRVKKPKEPNIYDVETEPESEDEVVDSSRALLTEEQTLELPSVDPAAPVSGEGDVKLSKADQSEEGGDSKDEEAQEKPQEAPVSSSEPPVSTLMQKNHSRLPTALVEKKESPKQEAEAQKPQTEKTPMQGQASTAERRAPEPPGPPFNPANYGLKQRMANNPSFPPAATKKDYQPLVSKARARFENNQKDKQTKDERRPIDQPPPTRRTGTAGEQKKLAGWNTFGGEARAKEKEEHAKHLKEAQNYEPTSANWEANLKWKQAQVASDTDADSGDSGQHHPAQEAERAVPDATEKEHTGEQSQSTQPPPTPSTAGPTPQTTETGTEINTQADLKDQASQANKDPAQEAEGAVPGTTEKEHEGEEFQSTQPPPTSTTAGPSPQTTETGTETNTQASPRDQGSQGDKGDGKGDVKLEDESQRDPRKDQVW